METQVKRTVTLSSSELKEAVREYISLHSIGEVHVPESFNVFVVLESGAREADIGIEAIIFE